MNNLVKFFGNSALNSFKGFSNSVNKAINDFEFEDIDKAFDDMQKRMDASFKSMEKRFRKRVKDSEDSYEINIPYDRNTDTLTTTINGDQFTAVVKSSDGTNERSTSIYIPEDVDINSVSRRYDEATQKMYFTFKKIVD